jgi:CAAX protease family protein
MYSMLKSKNLIAAIELVGFVAFALILKRVFDPLFWRYAGPVSLIIVLIVLTRYMRMRRETWAGMGLIALPGARAKLMLIPKTLLAFVGFAIAVATVLLGGEVLNLEFMSEIPEGVEDRWGDIKGNLPLYLLWLGIVWTAAAFGEEMFFRGFIITRLQSVFSGVKFASVIAVIAAAAFFGYVHMYYQGMRGFVTAGAIGLAFGATFLLMKRNLYPVILVHGIVDTIGFTARFMDWET